MFIGLCLYRPIPKTNSHFNSKDTMTNLQVYFQKINVMCIRAEPKIKWAIQNFLNYLLISDDGLCLTRIQTIPSIM